MKRILLLPVIAGVALLSFACSKEPTKAIAAARSALSAAYAADARDYAPEAIATAIAAGVALDAEIRAQASRSPITRSYAKTAELAAALQKAAEAAKAQATTAKQQAKAEAIELLASVRDRLATAKQALASTKGYVPGLGAMHSDLAIVEASLDRIDADVEAGRYLLAKMRAKAARATLERIVAGTQRTHPSASDSETLQDI